MFNYKFLKKLIYVPLAAIFIFIGYEYPIIIEKPKKYFKFYLKKTGFTESFIHSKQVIKTQENENSKNPLDTEKLIDGNSYDLKLEKILSFDGKTAGVFIDGNDFKKINLNVFLQNGLLIFDNKKVKEINIPVDTYFSKNGGVKSIIRYKKNYFALISTQNLNCFNASLINLNTGKKIFSTDCIDDIENIDFNGIGGAYIENNRNIFLTLGAPEWNSEKISSLAQEEKSFYGKIIKFKSKSFLQDEINPEDYKIFSLGHKNPQGLVLNENIIFSVEHGPQGGDEINLILEGKNYGWPIISYGTKYNSGKSYKKYDDKFEKPLFTFLPSVAPSSLNNCPENLKNYYKENYCLISLSLREMSLFVILIDKKKLNVINIEKFKIEQRLRHFGLNIDNKLFQQKNNFIISADGEGLYKVSFENFR